MSNESFFYDSLVTKFYPSKQQHCGKPLVIFRLFTARRPGSLMDQSARNRIGPTMRRKNTCWRKSKVNMKKVQHFNKH